MKLWQLIEAKWRFMFPSPCGEEVMKYTKSHDASYSTITVSVPLRGRGHEIGQSLTLRIGAMSFRPLAGKRS